MTISILGTRGIPARYGGNEVCAEQVATRLSARGYDVTVYCRGTNGAASHENGDGVKLVFLPSTGGKHLDTLSHSFLSALRAIPRRPDVLHCFGVGNAPLLPLLNRVGKRTVISVDGMDWRRDKWGRLAKLYLRHCAGLAVGLADACVTDSRSVARFYAEQFGKEPLYIPNGADTVPPSTSGALREYGLEKDRYVLFVGRLVPEKGVHNLIEAFAGLETDLQLAVAGDGSSEPDYFRRLQATSDERVRLLGPVYGEAIRELYSNAYAYVQPSQVEGTSLSVIEAMAHGNCVLVSDIPENLEAVGGAGLSFDSRGGPAALRQALAYLAERPEVVEGCRQRARRFAREHYAWESVIDQYEQLYLSLLDGRSNGDTSITGGPAHRGRPRSCSTAGEPGGTP
jgi:glycosyltransferase involved in cell wall biosynthesis